MRGNHSGNARGPHAEGLRHNQAPNTVAQPTYTWCTFLILHFSSQIVPLNLHWCTPLSKLCCNFITFHRRKKLMISQTRPPPPVVIPCPLLALRRPRSVIWSAGISHLASMPSNLTTALPPRNTESEAVALHNSDPAAAVLPMRHQHLRPWHYLNVTVSRRPWFC